jgi:hypothetical protein
MVGAFAAVGGVVQLLTSRCDRKDAGSDTLASNVNSFSAQAVFATGYRPKYPADLAILARDQVEGEEEEEEEAEEMIAGMEEMEASATAAPPLPDVHQIILLRKKKMNEKVILKIFETLV